MCWRDLVEVFIANTVKLGMCFQIPSGVRIQTEFCVCEVTHCLLVL